MNRASIIENVAKVCHEANRAYCETIGDLSQPSWEQAPAWQRKSAIAGVEGIARGDIQNPGDSHQSWLAEKDADGWRYGAIKDPQRKEHPCFVPFEKLPADQQLKDHLFVNVAKALLPKLLPAD